MTKRKCIFISGAASGIGRETALYFASRDWFVGATDVNSQGLETLQADIGPENCHCTIMDVTLADSVAAAMESFAAKTNGSMNLLFNNAGFVKFGRFENVALSAYHQLVDVNLKGILTCTHYALPMLKNTSESRIVSMASSSAIYGIPDLSVYSATKRAVLAMSEALDLELEKYGIVVSDIIVPYVNTPFLDVDEEVFSIQKMGIKIEPITVAKTVWKTAHKKKLHWKIGLTTHLLMAILGLLPSFRRAIVKHLTMGPAQ